MLLLSTLIYQMNKKTVELTNNFTLKTFKRNIMLLNYTRSDQTLVTIKHLSMRINIRSAHPSYILQNEKDSNAVI